VYNIKTTVLKQKNPNKSCDIVSFRFFSVYFLPGKISDFRTLRLQGETEESSPVISDLFLLVSSAFRIKADVPLLWSLIHPQSFNNSLEVEVRGHSFSISTSE
jgi:hypothetical protein